MSTPFNDDSAPVDLFAAIVRPEGTRGAPCLRLSEDAIARFLDVMTVRHGFDRVRHSSQRDLLFSLDLWMLRSGRPSLVNAAAADLQDYIGQFLADAALEECRAAERILSEFFVYLRVMGFRHDDPSQYLHADGNCESTLDSAA